MADEPLRVDADVAPDSWRARLVRSYPYGLLGVPDLVRRPSYRWYGCVMTQVAAGSSSVSVPRRARGSISRLSSGSLRVRVYAGTDPVTGRQGYLSETVGPGPT